MTKEKIFVVDNYDSFTYNLVHLLQELGYDYVVKRNDKFELEELDDYQHILLSPGPGLPHEAGLLMEVIKRYGKTKNILGICLGQQAIAEAFGGTLYNMPKPLHGVATDIRIIDANEKLYKNFPTDSKIGRYHSWAVDRTTLPSCLKITAVDPDDVIMALTHTEYNLRALQFHPESILTTNGRILLHNWLN